MAMASSANAGRLEDIYQEEVINAFVDLTQFKMFARSKHGLCLSEADVQNSDEDNKNSIDKKMSMLNKWQMKNGKDATASRIRYLVERYHKGDTPENYMTLRENLFGLFMDKKLSKNSDVYLGEQINAVTGSIPRAIKLIQYEENNLREAQILTTLGAHENVVSIIHVDKCRSEPNDYIYIVMELVSSENLRDLLEQTKKLGTVHHDSTLIDMAIQIMRALVFIHKKNIIHRDLKPENILLSEDRTELKLTDFGISKTIGSGFYTKQTNKGSGTDGYQSPESYNKDVISRKSDIFSAGITLTELFSNSRHPFGNEPDLWKYFIKTHKDPDISHIFIANKTPLESLIGRMLLFNPEERPTALEVLNLLRLFQDTINVHPTLSRAAEKPKKHHLAEDFQTLSVHMHPEEGFKGQSASWTKGEARKEVQLLEESKSKSSVKRFPEKVPQLEDSSVTPAARGKVHPTTSSTKTKEIIVFNRWDNHMHSFNPLTKDWKKKQAFRVYSGINGDWFTTLLLGQHIYILHHNEIAKLNYSDPNAEWNQVKNTRENHGHCPPAAVFNGSIHVCGSFGEVFQSVERFEERENKWIALPPYQAARVYHCIVTSKDHIYCIGGCDASSQREPKLSVERFDGERWEPVQRAPRGLVDASATVLEELIYVADDKGVLCYSIQTDSWDELNLSSKWPFKLRYFVKILNVDDKLYLISYGKNNKYEIYYLNPETEEMTLNEGINYKLFAPQECLTV